MTPDTVLRWQGRRFREHWTKPSGGPVGRLPVDAEINVFTVDDRLRRGAGRVVEILGPRDL